MTLRRVRRIAAYGVCRDDDGRVLLTRASDKSDNTGTWNLPGGGIDHGEAPGLAVVREYAEESGLVVEVTGLRDVWSEFAESEHRGFVQHQDTVVYDVRIVGGELTHETEESSDRVEWFTLAEIETLPLFDRVRRALGVTGLPAIHAPSQAPDRRHPAANPDRGQRFSAYGVVTDPGGRILLTLISDNYPGAGTWHLPGGGTDWGEEPAEALVREIAEETGQEGKVTELIAVTNQHNPAAWGPEGRPMDWHSVRVTYRVRVDAPTTPVVAEVNGSTADAAWYTPEEARNLRLNRLASETLRRAGLLSA
ncbi:NUDIX hydrolase [Longispora albida]|uniref:NUDIX hydrolase n=1 Tax=Longispora albida TaxID=203523 RepID=UPI0009FC51ED|nr:NUDIX domain-containing protein [Longispora albida]